MQKVLLSSGISSVEADWLDWERWRPRRRVLLIPGKRAGEGAGAPSFRRH